MKKFYKYSFGILLLTTITFLNLWQITSRGIEKDNKIGLITYERRITSLFASNTVLQRKSEGILGYDIVTSKERNNLLKDTTLVILLTKPKCGKCQEKELKRLSIINEKEGINVIGITTKAKINRVAIQRKILKLDFPIYWVNDTTFYDKLAFADEFPQILYIVDGIVVSAFKPLVKDDEFSEMYYKELLKMIKKNNNLSDEAK